MSSQQCPPNLLSPLTRHEFWLWLTRRRKRFRVKGRSMMPLLHPGDEVLVDWMAYSPSIQNHRYRPGPQLGDIVLVDDPRQSGFHLVKRVIKIQPPLPPHAYPKYWVEGENSHESTDSRIFGYVPHSCILGKVTSRFP